MPRPERPVNPQGPIATFAIGLRALRAHAGLSYRQMAERTHYCVSVLSTAASGEMLPTWNVTKAYVHVCGGHPEYWRAQWLHASAAWKGAGHGPA
ncbi:helix-turn-helix transcriptional regulator [Nonomuraea sp. NPDC049152]|uniref:helix-turn-helix domain-containing protein n=1 Tax=Nonomuraea sp. NPDC049152 TaxID=3154350 RepID=UPI0033F6456D